jgi:hypothetical protein
MIEMIRDSPSLDELLLALDSSDTVVAQEAQFSLEELGSCAVEPVLKALPGLGVFGQRCVLDLLTDWPLEISSRAECPSIADAIIPLLGRDDHVAREWAADVLGHVQVKGAILSLRQALLRAKQAGVDPAETEPVAYRRALTALGGRFPVIPALLGQWAHEHNLIGMHWPAELLPVLLDALAADRQLVLYCTAWQRRGDDFNGVDAPSFEVESHGAWLEMVHGTQRFAKQSAEWDWPPDTVVTLEWIDESDR